MLLLTGDNLTLRQCDFGMKVDQGFSVSALPIFGARRLFPVGSPLVNYGMFSHTISDFYQ